METNLPTPMTGRVELLICRVNHDEFSKKNRNVVVTTLGFSVEKHGFSVEISIFQVFHGSKKPSRSAAFEAKSGSRIPPWL